MKNSFLSRLLLPALALLTICALINTVCDKAKAASGDIIMHEGVWSGTASLSGTTTGTTTLFSFPALSGSFMFTAADIVPLGSGSLVGTLPYYRILGGTGNSVLTGSVQLTATTSAQSNRLTVVAQLPIVQSGTFASPLKLEQLTSGTNLSGGSAVAFPARIYIRGFFMQSGASQ